MLFQPPYDLYKRAFPGFLHYLDRLDPPAPQTQHLLTDAPSQTIEGSFGRDKLTKLLSAAHQASGG